MPTKRYFRLAEAVAMIMEEDSISEAELVVLPPSHVDDQSDCERCDEDDLSLADNNQPTDVAGEVEVHYQSRDKDELPVPDKTCSSGNAKRKKGDKAKPSRKQRRVESGDREASSTLLNTHHEEAEEVTVKSRAGPACDVCGKVTGEKQTKAEKPEPIETKWSKQQPRFKLQPTNTERANVSELTSLLISKSEVELFEEFWDGDMLDLVINQSNLYAQQQNRHEFNLKKHQLKRFLGFLLFSGYHRLPRERMYWENAEDCRVNIVSQALSRQEYMDIKRNLHLADNATVHACDKFYKLRRYMELLNERLSKFGVFAHNLCVDEQMIPYFGRHSCKMYMRGKPVRFGFKVWCLCSASGYLYKFIPYAGRDDNNDYKLGLGASVVLQLLDVVEEPDHHSVYFDNFFTSHRLLVELSKRKFCATGTVREPRLIGSTLEDSKSLAKKDRGSFDFRFDKANAIAAVKWNDNSVVTLASNFQTAKPLLTAKRFSRSSRTNVTVTQPNLIAEYNANMGGVDMLDNFVAKYRITLKGKKWWWPLFINFVDVALCNAWNLHRAIHGKELDLLEFRRRVTISLLKTEPEESSTSSIDHNPLLTGRPSALKILTDPRKSSGEHYIAKNLDGRRIRCRECKSTTSYVCIQCDIGMHAKCFAAYHGH